MASQDAVEETRRLLGLGQEQILRVTPENFELTATEAFPAFRRGVVRAEGCREVPAEELLGGMEGKGQVLAFLADFAERKRGYRRQVETVLRILLKCPPWMEAAHAEPDLGARLPGEEVAEMLAAASADAASGHAAQARAERASLAAAMAAEREAAAQASAKPAVVRTESEQKAIDTLQSSFQALVKMGDAAKLDDAAAEASRMGEAVAALLERNADADLEVIANLEPKVPVLRLLCKVHEKMRSHRSRVNTLLFSLMETASIGAWRAAAEADADVRGELEGLGILDHAYGNDVTGADSERESTGTCETAGSSSTRQVIWMWRDAGQYGGWFSHKLATMNPARWSMPCSLEEAIADLEQYLDTPSGERPVKVRVFGAGKPATTAKAASVAGAVTALRMLH